MPPFDLLPSSATHDGCLQPEQNHCSAAACCVSVDPSFIKSHHRCTHANVSALCMCMSRGDLLPDDDPAGFSPDTLLQRKPSLALVALFAILDPPREEAIEAAKVAHQAGITVKMITGGCLRD